MPHPLLSSLALLLCLTLTIKTAYSEQKTISTAADLKALADEVYNQNNYLGTTVVLANDIDMSGITDFTGIGRYDTSIINVNFRGVFDGKGYVIKNMNIVTSNQYTGLFGYTVGSTIKNVVIDSSCSVTSNYDVPNYVGYAGGIIGYADAGTGVGETRIQNCVNMGAITGAGTNSKVGGIAGVVYATRSPSTAVNCVNFGTVKYTGSSSYSYTGGIAGWMTLEESTPSIYNCVNFGTVTNTVGYAGGVVGYCSRTVGIMKHNYWLSGTSSQSHNGDATASDNYAFSSDYKIVSSDKSLITELNSYISSQSSDLGLRKWGTASFNTSGGSYVEPKTVALWVMLGTPDTPTKEYGTFGWWCVDAALTTRWTSVAQLGNGDVTIHAKWNMNQYTVSFDVNGGVDVPSVTGDYGSVVELKVPLKKGYSFNGWYDANGNVFTDSYVINKADNVRLTAQWTVNNYTVKFDVNGGEDIDESSKTVIYGEKYGELPEPINIGHNFLGWFTSNVSGEGELITNETTVDIDDNHTLYALWDVNNYTVTFDFGNGTEIDVSFVFDDEIIYPDDPTKEGHTFLGWNNTYDRMPAENIIIYAQWDVNNYTVTFDFGNGTVTEELLYYGDIIECPKNIEREGHTFVEWNNTYDRMPAEDITIYALWDVNNYTVTFDFGNGTVVEELFYYGDIITCPDSPEREGYTFVEWNNTHDRMPAEDITIKAIWKVIPTEYVKIEFNKKDMSESEIKDIISKYIDNTDYEIRIVESENGGTTVIIKFSDANEAENFVETIKESDDVKNVGYVDDIPLSFSKSVFVTSFLSFI